MAIYPKFTGVPYREVFQPPPPDPISKIPKEKTLGKLVSDLWEKKKEEFVKDYPDMANDFGLDFDYCGKEHLKYLPHKFSLEPTDALLKAYQSAIDIYFLDLKERIEQAQEIERKERQKKLDVVDSLLKSPHSEVIMVGKLLQEYLNLPLQQRNLVQHDLRDWIKIHLADIGLETYVKIFEKIL